MRKHLLLSALFLTGLSASQAQIPNAGFEDWTTVGNHENPDGWATMNGLSGTSFNSCTKSTDHYPANVGQYSVRLENNTALAQFTGGYGGVVTDAFNYPFQPAFPVIGNPTSLHGHFKFTSLNGDQVWVKLVLFNQGTIVADESYISEAQSYPEWTPFEIQLDDYGDADSATIMLFAFYPIGQTDGPNGNSVLWVDNLSFNSPITSVTEARGLSFNLYPNPATDMVTLTLGDTYANGQTVSVYSMLGSLVRSEAAQGNRHQMDVSSLPTGIYVVELRSAEKATHHRLHVVR
jgi:hypothetical protein